MSATFYARVSYYSQESDIEEFGTLEEALVSYLDAIDAQRDGAMGDVYCISYGEIVSDKMKRINAKSYD